MPKKKVLGGKDVVKIFEKFGFRVESQKGSHVKLSRMSEFGKQVLGVPLHKEIDRGTVTAMYK